MYFNKKRLFFASIIDKVLSLLYRFGNSPTENNGAREYRRILLLESHLIGDVIMTLPAYKAIREEFPDAGIMCFYITNRVSDQNYPYQCL
jgi:hypothetical protein